MMKQQNQHYPGGGWIVKEKDKYGPRQSSNQHLRKILSAGGVFIPQITEVVGNHKLQVTLADNFGCMPVD